MTLIKKSTVHELFSGEGWKITHEEATLPNGTVTKAGRAQTFDTAYLIALRNDRHVLILNEYRPFYGSYVWKLPTGKIKPAEDPAATAKRELREETGFDAKHYKLLWSGQGTERLKAVDFFFLAEDLVPSPLPPDEDELMEVHFQSLDKAINTLLASPIVHTPSVYALMRFQRERWQG